MTDAPDTIPPVYIQVPNTPGWIPSKRSETYLNAGATNASLGTLKASEPPANTTFFRQGLWAAGAAAVAFIASAFGVGGLVAFGFVFLVFAAVQFAIHASIVRGRRDFDDLVTKVRDFTLEQAGESLIKLTDLQAPGRGEVISLMLRLAAAREGALAAAQGRWTVPGEEKFTRALEALGAYAVALRDGHALEGPGGLGMAKARAADAVAECCAGVLLGPVPRADVERLERLARA